MPKPRFIVSKSKVVEQYDKVKSHADIVSYSSKTNQDITPILEKETDSMFSVHFTNELKHVTDKSRVIFLAQAWDNDQIHDISVKVNSLTGEPEIYEDYRTYDDELQE